MNDVHLSANEGFGRGAESYSRGRPDYPGATLDWLRFDLGLMPGMTVIEVGAGTGKFTRTLVRTGAKVIATDPVGEMLKVLRRELPAVPAVQATAQKLPLPDATADAVICAQSFHWFASPGALAEIRRVLVPGGTLGLVWNVRDQSVGWVGELTRIMEPYEGDAPRYDRGEWRRVFPAPGFGELRERAIPHAHIGPPEQVIVDRVASVSFISALEDATRARVLDDVRALIDSTPALAAHREVSFPYVTHVYWCHALKTK